MINGSVQFKKQNSSYLHLQLAMSPSFALLTSCGLWQVYQMPGPPLSGLTFLVKLHIQIFLYVPTVLLLIVLCQMFANINIQYTSL